MLRFLLVWMALAATVPAEVGPPRIAVVDMTAVFQANPQTKEAETKLHERRQEARKEFDAKAEALKQLLHDHQQVTRKLVATGEAADEALKAQAEELLEKASALERELATLRTTTEGDLEREFVAERRRILDRIMEVIEEFNHDNRYALILDRSAASSNGIPQVLHSPGAEDITAQIIAAASGDD